MRKGWLAAGLVVVASLVWLTASGAPAAREQESETDVDGVFEASVAGPPPQALHVTQSAATSAQGPQPMAAAPAATVKPDQNVPPMQGPVAALTERFETEPRDSAASDVESRVRKLFRRDGISPELFKSVLCRQSVCKVVVRLTSDRMPSYIQAMTALTESGFSANVAIAPTADADPQHGRYVELFLERQAQN